MKQKSLCGKLRTKSLLTIWPQMTKVYGDMLDRMEKNTFKAQVEE